MEISLENFEIRRSNPYIAGSQGLPEGTERYIAKAQGLIGIDIFEGDEISIKNIEGMQECEITAFDKKGANNLNIIGQQNNAEANYIKHILLNNDNHKLLLSKLKKRNIDFHNASSFNFFNNKSRAGESKDFVVIENGLIIISVPGKLMEVDKYDVSSDLEIIVCTKRNDIKKSVYRI